MSGEGSSDIPDPADPAAGPSSDPPASSDPADPMSPPLEPCECWCMHCRRTFMSNEIWLQRIVNDPAGSTGTWMCPTANCDGVGFSFDIWPTDPEHPVNRECTFFDDPDEDDDDLSDVELLDGDGADSDDALAEFEPAEDVDVDADWDPEETKWKELDEFFAGEEGCDDDIEGEEWKYGLQPGERPSRAGWGASAGSEDPDDNVDAEAHSDRRYDEPDRRPREIDWSDREDRRGGWTEDDIPF